MATSATIPRFLLPKLSWKATISSSAPLPLAQIQRLFTKPIRHRYLSSTPQTRQREAPPFPLPRRSRQKSTIVRSSIYRREVARSFSTTKAFHRDHHFDTLKTVQRLKDEGFSEEQSKAMMLVLSDVIEESIQNLTRTMVLREGILHVPDGHWPFTVLNLGQTPTEAPTPRR